MSDQTKEQKNFGMTFPFVLPNVTETLQDQMRAVLGEHSELFDETRKAMAAWTKRSQEAMEAGAQTFQAMCSCKDPGTIAALYGDWLSGSMKRALADINETRDDALRLAAIGQKSMTAIFQHGANAVASTSAALPVPSAKATGRTAGTSRTDEANRSREHAAAE